MRLQNNPTSPGLFLPLANLAISNRHDDWLLLFLGFNRPLACHRLEIAFNHFLLLLLTLLFLNQLHFVFKPVHVFLVKFASFLDFKLFIFENVEFWLRFALLQGLKLVYI